MEALKSLWPLSRIKLRMLGDVGGCQYQNTGILLQVQHHTMTVVLKMITKVLSGSSKNFLDKIECCDNSSFQLYLMYSRLMLGGII